MKKYNHCDSRKGDLSEFYAVTWLWDRGYEVFKNCGCTGSVDLIAMNKKGDIKFIDVKSFVPQQRPEGIKGPLSKANSRSSEQKKIGVQILGFNPETRKLRFIKHKEGQHNDKA